MPGTFSRAVVRVMNLERTLLFFRSFIFPSRTLTLLLLPSLFPNRLSFSLSRSLCVCCGFPNACPFVPFRAGPRLSRRRRSMTHGALGGTSTSRRE